MADVTINIKANDQATKTLKDVDKELGNLGDTAGDSGGATKGFGEAFASAMFTINQTLGVLNAAYAAMEKVYGIAKEGAELDYAATRFDNLAESIGAVSSVLLDDLKDATEGMYSDAELMASAGDFMALGLANTSDEVIRLSTVAGALGMNMNQLVLTLTNQTTKRFDALGVSVAGFDEKVQALEDSGMSASDAFAEAFLQQAEEQIERVGSAAETTKGTFMEFEASSENLGSTIKTYLAGSLEDVIPIATEFSDTLNTSFKSRDYAKQVGEYRDSLIELGYTKEELDEVIGYTKDFYLFQDALLMEESKQGIENLEAFMAAELLTKESQEEFAASLLETSTSWDEFASGMSDAGLDLGNMTEEVYNNAKALDDEQTALGDAGDAATAYGEEIGISAEQTAKFKAELDKITDLGTNFSGIISYAEKYDANLEDITEQQEILANTEVGTEQWDAANAKLEDLKTTMSELAAQVVLDMFQATIAIGGITETEAAAYFQLAEDMGIISAEAAQEAMDVYGEAIDFINGLEIDDKSATFTVNYAAGSFTGFEDLGDYYKDIYGPGHAAGGAIYANRAIGGLTPAAGGYWVGEVGPEPFFPAESGRILSHTDAMTAMRGDSGFGGGGDIDAVKDLAKYIQDAEKRLADLNKEYDYLIEWQRALGDQEAVERLTKELQDQQTQVTDLIKYYEDLNKAVSATENVSTIIGLARSYDSLLEELAEKQQRMYDIEMMGAGQMTQELLDEHDALSKEVDSLQKKMQDMANQVMLDMYRSTLAVGGFTEAEMEQYFKMADELGIISKEASDKAMDTWKKAQEEIMGGQTSPSSGGGAEGIYGPVTTPAGVSSAPISVTINSTLNLADKTFVEQELIPLIRDVLRRERA